MQITILFAKICYKNSSMENEIYFGVVLIERKLRDLTLEDVEHLNFTLLDQR